MGDIDEERLVSTIKFEKEKLNQQREVSNALTKTVPGKQSAADTFANDAKEIQCQTSKGQQVGAKKVYLMHISDATYNRWDHTLVFLIKILKVQNII